jgi:hypothetical protein
LKSLSCDCGFSVEKEDRYKVEAAMWFHAIHDHPEMLKSMTVEQLEQWLKHTNQQLSA